MNRTISRRGVITSWLAGSLLPSTFAAGPSPPGPSPPITALTYCPEGRSILAGSQSGVLVQDAESGNPITRIQPDMENVHHLQFSPDGKIVAVAGGTPAEMGVVALYDWPDWQRRQKIELHDDLIYGFDFSGDGDRWVAASGDEQCSVYQIGHDKPRTRFTKHSRAVLAAAFLPDCHTVVSGSRDQTLRVWESNAGQDIRTMHNHSRDVHALAVCPKANALPMIASASADMTIRFWQPTIGRMVRFIRLPSEPLCITWFDGGEKLLAGCRDGKARVIDPIGVQVEDTIEVSGGWLYCVSINPKNTRRAAVGSSDGQIRALEL